MDDPSAAKTFAALAPGVYWIIVESYPNLPGTTSVTLSTGSVATPEICANGRDDDGNGLIDCQDAACSNHASCIGSQCVPDFNIGTLVVDGPARSATVDTRTAADDYQSTCSAGVAGGDIAIEFTLAETAGLEVEFQQTGRSIFALYRMPPPGLACDADQVAVRVRGRRQERGRVPQPVRRDATCSSSRRRAPPWRAPSTCGSRRSAVRRVEICGNRIDDDSDGLTDCDDPECFGLAICPAPACSRIPGPRELLVGNAAHGHRRYARSGVTL